MSQKTTSREAWKRERQFDREMLRSVFLSIFTAVVQEKRKRGYKMSDLAAAAQVDKGRLSREFNGLPNWQIDTIADYADALGLDLIIKAKDRETGLVYTESGIEQETPMQASLVNAQQIRSTMQRQVFLGGSNPEYVIVLSAESSMDFAKMPVWSPKKPSRPVQNLEAVEG